MMKPNKVKLIQSITSKDYNCLQRDLNASEESYFYTVATYGCLSKKMELLSR